MGTNLLPLSNSKYPPCLGLNEIVNPEKSPARKKRHDLSSYEQEIRNKLNGSSPSRSHSITPTTSPILSHSPTTTTRHDPIRFPLPTIATPNHVEKSKPHILSKRMGLKHIFKGKLRQLKNSR